MLANGYSEKKIDKINNRKNNFKLNSKIRKEIVKFPSKISLITINPTFEKLIGISEKKSDKPYKAQKCIENIDEESIKEEIKQIIEFIIDFTEQKSRIDLESLEIITSD